MNNKLLEMIESGLVSEVAKSAKDNDVTLSFEFGKVCAFVTEFDRSGRFSLNLDDLKVYLKSKSEYFASYYDVSVKQYELWREESLKVHRCQALTSKGNPCQSHMIPEKYRISNHPADFDPNISVYCSVHEDRAMNIKK